MPNVAPPPLVAVVGPTATGKSGLGVALAATLGGEVVNADAMALYRGMDIGTAKLTPAERAGVPHHLLDVLDVTETASVAAYQRAARAVIEDLRAAGRTPVLVGGSGLYVQAVVDELEFPGTDAALRAGLEAELADVGPAALHARLAAVDPAAAAAVLPGNGRRIVRALEVVTLTGRPFPARLAVGGPPRYDAVLLGVDRPTGELDERVARRVARMFAAGLVDETRTLLGVRPAGGADGRAGAGLPAGRGRARRRRATSLPAAADTVRATRRFVRRQRSWFRRDRRIAWLDARPRPARPGPRPAVRRLARVIRFAKGHGTENDFVVLPDAGRRARPDPRPGRRAVRPAARPRRRRGAAGGPLGRAEGRRVPRRAGRRVVHGLPQRRRRRRRDVRQRRAGVRPLPGRRRVAARGPRGAAAAGHPGGVREVRFTGADGGGDVAVDMGPARLGGASTATVGGRAFAGIAVDVGNPHLACVTDAALDALDLTAPARPTTRRCSRTG